APGGPAPAVRLDLPGAARPPAARAHRRGEDRARLSRTTASGALSSAAGPRGRGAAVLAMPWPAPCACVTHAPGPPRALARPMARVRATAVAPHGRTPMPPRPAPYAPRDLAERPRAHPAAARPPGGMRRPPAR